MQILKKDLYKYKDLYKFETKILDRLLCYCLYLIKNNFKDNIDLVKYVDSLRSECNLLALALSTLWIQQEDLLDRFFRDKKVHILLSDKSIFGDIKDLYEEFKKVALSKE